MSVLDIEDRFWGRVIDGEGGCWLWTGATNSRGYGLISYLGDLYLTHRFAYWQTTADIPDGLTIDHLCGNKLCVNPDHLEPVPLSENVSRATRHRTHCKRGHEWRLRADGRSRYCPECENARRRVPDHLRRRRRSEVPA